jgi:SecD/SecF fusion protein
MHRFHVPFMEYRWYLLGFSAVLIVLSLGTMAYNYATTGAPLNFGIEFRGGTSVTISAPGATATADALRASLAKLGAPDAVVQTERDIRNNQVGGFLIRLGLTDSTKAQQVVQKALAENGIKTVTFNVTTIGPNWGAQVTNSAIIALAVSMLAILIYVSIRFDYKMSVTAVVALFHDVIIVLGVYAITQREMTPNTIAALLTILGYSLYDTIVVFHRIKENSQHIVKQTFMQMANESINQVFVRWINTSLTAIVPPLTLLFFGGDTLKDFAFALTIGLISGAYSSVAVASPLYAMWKEREPKFQALKKKFGTPVGEAAK